MNFKDPVTTFAYNLVSLHHDVMWYIIIILCLVYWSLYKILKDNSWNIFKKQEGFLLLLHKSKTLVNIQMYIFIICFYTFKYIIEYSFRFFSKIIAIAEDFTWNSKGYRVVKLYGFFLGKQYFKDLTISQYVKWHDHLDYEYVMELLV